MRYRNRRTGMIVTTDRQMDLARYEPLDATPSPEPVPGLAEAVRAYRRRVGKDEEE